ncbi:MAG: AMP-binding protein [Mycolicibacterium sp.]|nr:AMP-binding protein [Mycolicibacterium sp.]
MTMGDIVNDNADRFPDVVAYRLGPDEITHSELRERAVRLVSALSQNGLRRQDRIAVMSRNRIEFGELFAATHLSGIVMATISFRWSRGEVLEALRRVTPSIVFCDGEFAPMIGELITELPGVRLVVSLGAESWPQMTSYDDFIAQGAPGELALTAQSDDIACLLFTSGTTGASKCCILGHRELRRIAFSMNVEMRCGSDDRGLINMPMFHFGAVAIIGGLHARGSTVVLQKQFNPAEAVALIAEHDLTVLHLAPVMLQTLLDTAVTGEGLGSVRTIVYAAAPMTPHTLRQALRTLPKVGFLNLYGQTEVTVSGLPRELHVVGDPESERMLGSVGFPFPGVRVRIVDDDGRDVEPGLPGEIVVQSNSMFRGYWNDHAATLATLGDGWCHTGDVGRFDARGLLYLIDRKKDVIITGGENVYSPEVEDAVLDLEQVKACAVVGAPDRQWGEAVCVVVVPYREATLTLSEVQDAVRTRLARYKVPRRLLLVEELPVLASGKVDKKLLRSMVVDAERDLERE